MTDFPWDISIGIGIVLLGTGAFVAWVLTLDSTETASASKERFKPKDHQQEHQYPDP